MLKDTGRSGTGSLVVPAAQKHLSSPGNCLRICVKPVSLLLWSLPCLLCVIVLLAMIWILLYWLAVPDPQIAPLDALVFLIAFCAIIVYSFFPADAGIVSLQLAG